MKKYLVISLLIFSGYSFADSHEYPTEETVRYVLGCMAALGGETDENLYTCTCRYDSIRSQMTYSDYEEGVTFERNKAMPGEKGAAFRDNKRGESFYEKLVEARDNAANSCIVVKKVEMKEPDNI